jgi:hypothetical protein
MKTLLHRNYVGLSKGRQMSRAKVGAVGGACVLVAGIGLGVFGAQGASASPSSHPWPWAASHAPAPIVQNAGDGPILAAPRVVPIFFASDPLLPDLEAFYAKLGTSTYLSAGLAEYGVGKATFAPPVVRPDAPPAATDDYAVSVWLLGEIASGALPPLDANTVYSLVFPATTQVTAGFVGPYPYPYPLCGSTNEATQTASGQLVPFVISGLCEGATGGASDLSYESENQAFALVAAFTNPGSQTVPAYSDLSWSGSGWAYFAGGYVSTLCSAFIHQPIVQTPSDLGYPVPVLWSNEAARNGHDPCAVASSASPAVYFNAAPDLTGTATQYGMVKGLILPPGGKVTIPVRLFSDGPIGSWTLGASERSDLLPDANNVLSFAFDKASGTNGDVRQLTVSRAVAPDGSLPPALGFEITSTHGPTVHEWFVVVGND